MPLTQSVCDKLAKHFDIQTEDVDYWADQVETEMRLGAPRLEVRLQNKYGWAAGTPGKAGLFINALIDALRP
jgi:hypothetical protein